MAPVGPVLERDPTGPVCPVGPVGPDGPDGPLERYPYEILVS